MIFNPSPPFTKSANSFSCFAGIPSLPDRRATRHGPTRVSPALICPVTISPVKTCPIQSSSSIRRLRKPPPCPIRPLRTHCESARILVAASHGSTS